MFEVLEAGLLSLEQLDHSTERSSLDHLIYSELAYSDGSTREQFCKTNSLDIYPFLIQNILEHKQKRKTDPTICLAVFICPRAVLWWS